MMRFNDIIYALPALPFLIILAVTISNSIFLMIGFLMIFSWVGVAKVSRSMSLQIKTWQYVEAAKIMGQKDRKIIFRHIIPQLLHIHLLVSQFLFQLQLQQRQVLVFLDWEIRHFQHGDKYFMMQIHMVLRLKDFGGG